MFDPKMCDYCGVAFFPNRRHQKYCCKEHKREAFYARRAAMPPSHDRLRPLAPQHWEQEHPELTQTVEEEVKEKTMRERPGLPKKYDPSYVPTDDEILKEDKS